MTEKEIDITVYQTHEETEKNLNLKTKTTHEKTQLSFFDISKNAIFSYFLNNNSNNTSILIFSLFAFITYLTTEYFTKSVFHSGMLIGFAIPFLFLLFKTMYKDFKIRTNKKTELQIIKKMTHCFSSTKNNTTNLYQILKSKVITQQETLLKNIGGLSIGATIAFFTLHFSNAINSSIPVIFLFFFLITLGTHNILFSNRQEQKNIIRKPAMSNVHLIDFETKELNKMKDNIIAKYQELNQNKFIKNNLQIQAILNSCVNDCLLKIQTTHTNMPKTVYKQTTNKYYQTTKEQLKSISKAIEKIENNLLDQVEKQQKVNEIILTAKLESLEETIERSI